MAAALFRECYPLNRSNCLSAIATASSTAFFALSRSSATPALPAASHEYLFLSTRETLPSFVFPSQRTWPLYALSHAGFCFDFFFVAIFSPGKRGLSPIRCRPRSDVRLHRLPVLAH